MSSSVLRNSAELRIKRSFSFTLAFKFLASSVAVLHAILFSTTKSHQHKMHVTLRHDHVSCDSRNMQFHPHMYCCFSSSSTPVVLEPWDSFISCSNTSVLEHSPHDGGETHNAAFLACIPLTPSSLCPHPDSSWLRSQRALCFLY